MKTQIKQTIAKLSALAFIFSLVVVAAPADAATDDTRDVTINATVLASLQLEVNAANVDITVDPDVNGGTNATGGVVADSTTTTVNTNNQDGYKLTISLAGAQTGAASLDAQNITGASIVAGNFADENTFGFALNTSTASTVTAFNSVASNITGAGLGAPTNGHNETIYYYLNVDYTTPADIYQGTVTYTAVAL